MIKKKSKVDVVTSIEISGNNATEVISKKGLSDSVIKEHIDFYKNKGIPVDENENAIFIRYDLLEKIK